MVEPRAGRGHGAATAPSCTPGAYCAPSRGAAVLGARRADRPVAGDVHAAARLLAGAGLGRAAADHRGSTGHGRALPAGDAGAVGRARRRRRRRRLAAAQPPAGRRRAATVVSWAQRRRVHRARRRRAPPPVWSPASSRRTRYDLARSGRAQPPLRAPLDDGLVGGCRRPPSGRAPSGRRSHTPSVSPRACAAAPRRRRSGGAGRAEPAAGRGVGRRAATSNCASIPGEGHGFRHPEHQVDEYADGGVPRSPPGGERGAVDTVRVSSPGDRRLGPVRPRRRQRVLRPVVLVPRPGGGADRGAGRGRSAHGWDDSELVVPDATRRRPTG